MRSQDNWMEFEDWVIQYFAATSLMASSQSQIRYVLCKLCHEIPESSPGTTLLQCTATTDWVAAWLAKSTRSEVMSANYLNALCRWWQWLFDTGRIQSNALAFISSKVCVAGHEPVLTLPPNLHRHTDVFLRTQAWCPQTRLDYTGYIRSFVKAVAQRHASQREALPDLLTDKFIGDWARELHLRKSSHVNYQRFILAEQFCAYLCAQGVLTDNPIARLVKQFPKSGKAGVLRALSLPEPEAALQQLRRPKRFTSPLAEHAEAFIALKRAMGRRYEREERIIADLDRFISNEMPSIDLTEFGEALSRYFQTRQNWQPRTRMKAIGPIRQYCWYLYRGGIIPKMPDWTLLTVHAPMVLPSALTPEQVRQLLQAAKTVLHSHRWPLLPVTMRTIFLLQYGAGLRAGEAVHLNIKDVDLSRHVLTIRRSKFGKTRMVPLHPSLGHALCDYASQRDRELGPSDASSPFFQTSRRSPYGVSHVDEAFQRIRRFLGWEQSGSDHPPTPHSLRHSFAHECLLRWYREGADIQAKLPLLSTYMGHVNIAATQIYLQGMLAVHEAAMRRFAEYGGAIIACEEDINESK